MSTYSVPFFPCALLPCESLYFAILICLVATSVICTEPGHPAEYSPQGWLRPELVAFMTAALIIIFSTELSGFDCLQTLQPRAQTIQRRRRSVASLFAELGPGYVSRAYRMDESAFWTLHQKLGPSLRQNKVGPPTLKRHKNGAANGLIHSSVRLSIAL
jgi:hypothetical protein